MRRLVALLPLLAAAGIGLAPANATPTADPPPILKGDFTLTATSSAPSVAVGSPVTVNVTLVNTGTAELATPLLTAAYPTQVAELSSATDTTGGCSSEITCTFATVAPGQRVDATITFKALAPGTITVNLSCSAKWSAIAGLPSVSSKTQATSATITVTPRIADLNVTLTAPTKQTIGKVVKAVALVANRGANDAPGAAVDVTLPAGVKLVAISSPQGTCSLASRRCTFASLAPSASARITLSLLPSRPGARAVVAHVTPGSAVDPSGSNNVGKLVLAAQVPPAKRRHSA